MQYINESTYFSNTSTDEKGKEILNRMLLSLETLVLYHGHNGNTFQEETLKRLEQRIKDYREHIS